MKTLTISFVCLVVGLTVGFAAGYHYYERNITSQATVQMMQLTDSGNRLAAARGVRAIEMIQSGNTQRAIQMFSVPVASFYSEYVHLSNNDAETKKLLDWIELAARTNTAVADAIANKDE